MFVSVIYQHVPLQGDPLGQRLYFVDFDLGVPLIQGIPFLPDLHLPKQNKADIETTKSKSTKCSRRQNGSPCTNSLPSRTRRRAQGGHFMQCSRIQSWPLEGNAFRGKHDRHRTSFFYCLAHNSLFDFALEPPLCAQMSLL